ncbi:alpha/beta fold hydrolase [Streptomyces sp. NPDC001822]|uniref:alpha/beta fold hydrolase n=1 Tax=Streptomyces sp. NPDC001822 TaxID=3364614 RepID=UPI0036844F43
MLLHGVGNHRQAWDPALRILAAERDVIAVDLPGFGSSPSLPDGLSCGVRTVVPVLASFFEAVGLVRPHVAGNSLGGLLALELGQERSVRSASAFSPAGFWTRERAQVRLRGTPRDARSGARNAVALALDHPSIAQRCRHPGGRAVPAFTDDLPGIPVTAAWGARDLLLPVGRASG